MPVPARQDPGGLADVSCLSGVRGPDKCRGRARGSAVSSGAQPGQPWGTPLPGSAGHAGAAARRPWVPSDWLHGEICSGQRYGMVFRSLTAPGSRRQQSIPLGTYGRAVGAAASPWAGGAGWIWQARQLPPWISAAFHAVSSPSRPHSGFISSVEISPWRENPSALRSLGRRRADAARPGRPRGAAGSCRQLCWQEAARTLRSGTCLHPTSQVGKLRHGPARWGWGHEVLRRGWAFGVLHSHRRWRVMSWSGCSRVPTLCVDEAFLTGGLRHAPGCSPCGYASGVACGRAGRGLPGVAGRCRGIRATLTPPV